MWYVDKRASGSIHWTTAKWPSAKHASVSGKKVKADKSRNGLTETRLGGLVRSRKEHGPLICKHFPFLELSSGDVKQIIASAPRSFADFKGFFSI